VQLPVPPKPKPPSGAPGTAGADSGQEGVVGVQARIDTWALTPQSAGALNGASGKGTANLSMTDPPIGLKLKLPLAPGERLIVQVRIAVNRNTQRIDVDQLSQPNFTIESHTGSAPVEPLMLQDAVKKTLLEYRFNVEYSGIDIAGPELTEWNVSLEIGVV
jgi:hypothetical protein